MTTQRPMFEGSAVFMTSITKTMYMQPHIVKLYILSIMVYLLISGYPETEDIKTYRTIWLL